MSTEPELVITRTNTRRYVGACLREGCGYRTPVVSLRLRAGVLLRDHGRTVHGISVRMTMFDPPTKGTSMKKPNAKLPDPERLSDYPDHLVVFTDAKPGAVKSQYGTSECDCLVYVYLKDAWKALGETPIFWKTVGKQIMEAIGDEPNESFGGYLRQGSERNEREWNVAPVPASAKTDTKVLAGFDKDHSEPF